MQPNFNSQHHDIYNALRNTLMGFVQAGIPGMDQVLNALNQQHTKMLTPQQAATQLQGGKGATAQPMQQQPVSISQSQQSGGNPLASAAAALLQQRQGGQMGQQMPQQPMQQSVHGYQ